MRKPHQPSAAHLRQHRVQLQVERTPRHLQALAAAKRGLRQAEGREAQPTLDRTLKLSDLSPRDPTNLKATLAYANRVPTPGNLTLTNPAQPKGQPEHIIARKQANAKPVVRPSDLKDNNNWDTLPANKRHRLSGTKARNLACSISNAVQAGENERKNSFLN